MFLMVIKNSAGLNNFRSLLFFKSSWIFYSKRRSSEWTTQKLQHICYHSLQSTLRGSYCPRVSDKGEAGLQCSVTQEKVKEITFVTGSSFSVTCSWQPDPNPHPKPALMQLPLPLNDSKVQSHLKTQTSYLALQGS